MRVVGILQPFNDAIKLFTKENVVPRFGNGRLFFVGPGLGIGLAILTWSILPLDSSVIRLRFRIILLYTVIRINIYPLIMSGWSSNSNYAMIGALRGIAQTISYEVCFALLILLYLMLGGSLRIYTIIYQEAYWIKAIVFLPIIGLWLIISLAETNRTPFDFAEGESELVSGFNIEYGAVGFALIFMAEYARIFFMSGLITLIFFSSSLFRVSFVLITTRIVFVWVWVRVTLPRYRYDLLISLAWRRYLPLSLNILFLRLLFFL